MIGIDEAQFFDDLYDFCCKAADCDGKTLIVAGLDGDYLRFFLIIFFVFPSLCKYAACYLIKQCRLPFVAAFAC